MLIRVFVSLLFFFSTLQASADEGQEFLMSCTYGVLAGALVGAATLAIEDDPDEKIHRIARGASLGLYTGILLGLYVVYLLPAQLDRQEEQELEQFEGALMTPPRMIVYPLIENEKITGAGVNVSVFRF